MKTRYVIITPAFNEEANIRYTFESVIKQTIQPTEWIIVNDGSTDSTADIINEYSAKHKWIKILDLKKQDLEFGTHAVVLFYKGFEEVLNQDYHFIVKLDADLDIDRNDFFEYQLSQFDQDSKLGISSGITYSIKKGRKVLTSGRPYWRTGGAMKMYRKECFEEIKGIKPIYGWDGLDEYQAMFNGWKTRTFFDLHVNHLGKARAVNREKQLWLIENKGISLYKRGLPFEFVLLKALAYAKSNLKKSKAFLKGYYGSRKTKLPRVVTKKEMRFFRKLQYLRFLDKFTRKQLL